MYHHAYSYCKWRLANCFYFYKTFGISAQLLKRTRITRIRRVNTIRKTVVKTRFERGFRFKVYTAIFHYTRCFIVSIRTKNKNTRTNHRFRRYMPLLARSIFPIQPYSVFSITNTMAGVRSDNNRVKHNGTLPRAAAAAADYSWRVRRGGERDEETDATFPWFRNVRGVIIIITPVSLRRGFRIVFFVPVFIIAPCSEYNTDVRRFIDDYSNWTRVLIFLVVFIFNRRVLTIAFRPN